MKKLLLLPIFAALILSCNGDDDATANNEMVEIDSDNDGIPDSEDTCLDCTSGDFNFSVCDGGTFAEISSTNEDGTTQMDTIPYDDNVDFEKLTALNCEELNEIYRVDSTPKETCITCTKVEVCENEDGEGYTAIYNGIPFSNAYEEGETFESLTCEILEQKLFDFNAATTN